jgi:hypothetical protein
MRAAKTLVDHSRATIRRFATGDLAAISDPIAARILTHMREDPKEVLSRTAISCDIFGRNVPAVQLENAISLLIHLGLLRQTTVQTSKRPTTVYALQ